MVDSELLFVPRASFRSQKRIAPQSELRWYSIGVSAGVV